jgi:hypothetical protein
MASVIDQQRRMLSIGDGTVHMEQWRIERLEDLTFEYHSFVGHNYNQPTGAGTPTRLSVGAVFMIIRITDPQDVNSVYEYYMGRTGLPGDADDTLTPAWTGRAALDYKRFDECLREFFS